MKLWCVTTWTEQTQVERQILSAAQPRGLFLIFPESSAAVCSPTLIFVMTWAVSLQWQERTAVDEPRPHKTPRLCNWAREAAETAAPRWRVPRGKQRALRRGHCGEVNLKPAQRRVKLWLLLTLVLLYSLLRNICGYFAAGLVYSVDLQTCRCFCVEGFGLFGHTRWIVGRQVEEGAGSSEGKERLQTPSFFVRLLTDLVK